VLKSKRIFLRQLQTTDVDTLLKWENNKENWKVSGTTKPYTKEQISAFVSEKQKLQLNKQIRYVICLVDNFKPIGTIDLFEFDNQNKSVGVGVLIADKAFRKRGYGSEALKVITNYCRNERNIVTIFCSIYKENTESIRLFEKNGFQFIEEHLLFKQTVNYYELKMAQLAH
jgi:diamine N-acetyltransferase